MNKSLLSKITNKLKDKKNKSIQQKIFITLAAIVFITTIYILMKPAITMEEVLICNIDEHTHTEECYEEKFICTEETEENLNNESCYEKTLIHEAKEHTHTEDCYVTTSDKEDIDYLTNIIEKLPTVDEMNNHIKELSTKEEQEEYREEIIATATNAYSYYLNLDEKVQTKITNIDKLLEYEEKDLIEIPKDSSNQVVTFNNSNDYSIEPILDNDNSSKLETVETADTSNIININLYDYLTYDEATKKGINDNFKTNNKYPGFHQSTGPYKTKITSLQGGWFNFSDMITTDRLHRYDKTMEIANTINAAARNEPLSGYIKETLGEDNYPAIKDGNLSLKYLFSQDEPYVKKQNTNSINGLFQYNETTGLYSFDSRKNFAQFNKELDTFTVYKQNITPNFMQYPFGNFLPLNDIKTEATQASLINRAKFEEYIDSARKKEADSDTYGGMTTHYGLVADRMEEFLPLIDKANNDNPNWDAGFVATQYFKVSKLPPTIETSQLTDLYNIDFDEPVNFFFGVDMEMNFIQPKDGLTGKTKEPMIFDFSGDDDVYVFIDGILFLDLSGRHRHVGGKINFEKGIVTYHALDPQTGDTSETPYKTITFAKILENIEGDKPELNSKGTFKNYSSHNFKFYYMERGSGSGVMKMNFNFPLVEKNSLTVTKELDNNDVELVGNPDFSFQILKPTNGEKTATDEPFIIKGTTYDILDLNGNKIDTAEVLESGVFKLKAGQTAVFKEISADKGSYYVREILDQKWASQYKNVTVDGESTTTNEDIIVGTDNFVGYESGIKDISDGHTTFVYTNKVDPYKFGTLKITKELEGISNIEDTFKFKVTIDNKVLPLGYKYNIVDEENNIIAENKTIDKDCENCDYGYVLLSAGQTAIIDNILAGSSYKVEEIITAISGFDIKYNNKDVDYIEGEIVSEEVVEITVTNISTGTDLKIPITKTIANPTGESYNYKFKITEMESSDPNASEKSGGYTKEVTINNVTDTKTLEEAFKLEYSRPNYDEGETKHYYKIEEISGTDTKTKYDNSIYIVRVTVTNTLDNFNAKVTKIYKDYKNITAKDDNGNVTNIIEFINKILVDLTITKEVEGNINDSGEFEFEIEIIDDSTPITGTYNYQKKVLTEDVITFQDIGITPFGEEQETESINQPEEGIVTFDEEGKTTIELSHNEVITIYGIPYDAQIKVTELNTNGYVVMHSINSETEQEGYEVTGKLDRANTNIKFINIGGYIMPETGGSGTLIYGIIGLLLLIVPIIYIGCSFYKHRRSVV